MLQTPFDEACEALPDGIGNDGPELCQNHRHVDPLNRFRSGKTVDVPAEAGVGERPEHQFRMALNAGGVPGHQRDTVAGCDHLRGDEELVDPMTDARLGTPDALAGSR